VPAAIPIVAAVIGAGGAVYSANKNSKSADKAANKQAKGIEAGIQLQREFTDRALNQLGTNFQNARTSLLSGQEQFGRIFDESGNIISGGYDRARGDITAGARGAEDILSPAYQRGESSSQLQAAFSGLMGPEAQQQAYANFQESPGTDWLRKKQEEARLRTFARLGGGLGNQSSVMSALAEDEFGRAQTDFGNYYGRLSEISGRGDAAASNIANIRTNLGANLGNMSTGEASALAGLVGTRASGAQSTMQNLADLFRSEGATASNIFTGAGTEQSNLAQNLGAARAGSDIYAAQNTPAMIQGLQAGLGAYTASGGNFGTLFQGGGNATNDYTGAAYQNWLRSQQ
jgi:hypothetical protein